VIKDLGPGDPASVGPYRLLGRLGAGGMGQVYLAKSPGGRLVAIKLIRPELAEERGFRSRFSSEISAAKNVSGIYTAAVVDADAEGELPWMATVYVPGPSLADAVEDNGPLPVKSVLALAAGLAEALQAIHRAGLVHRDLKPSNVLLAEDGPRVIDFGISLALERSMMTATGMVMGSPGFMSPEQATGQREVGAPTDVFSLGAVLAFAATGNNPFGSGPTPALLYRVVNETPDLAAVPAPLTSLIGQCLAKHPAARPTPAELLERLSGDVGVLTGEWLPRPITETMKQYTPTMQTPLPPDVREGEQRRAGLGPVAAAAAVVEAAAAGSAVSSPAGQAGYEATALAPSIPPPAAAGLSAPTREEGSLLAVTALAAQPGAVTAGRDVPGGTGGRPPAGPASRRRWLWLAAAAAAAIIVAVVAVLLTSHSSGGTPKPSVTPSVPLVGKTHPPSKAPAKHPTATASSAVVSPGTQAATPTSGTSTSSPTATFSPTTTPTATATTAPTTTAPTQTSTTTTAPTQPPASNPAATAPAQSPTP
jgi:eukaryotic-like serine/threonine-protein kinase